MKINIDMENLSTIIEHAVNKNVDAAINETIKIIIFEWIQDNYKDAIESIVEQKAKEYVNEYLGNAIITVGGGLSDEELKTIPLETYVKSKFSDIIRDEMLTVKRSRGWDNYTETISFKEYIDSQLDPSAIVKKELEPFLKNVKAEINEKVKKTFDSSAKAMLSDAVYNILMCNDTYKKMQNNIAMIAEKE